jgi:hypothetical protein
LHLHHSDGQVLVWKRPREHYHEHRMDSRVAFECGGRYNCLGWGRFKCSHETYLFADGSNNDRQVHANVSFARGYPICPKKLNTILLRE